MPRLLFHSWCYTVRGQPAPPPMGYLWRPQVMGTQGSRPALGLGAGRAQLLVEASRWHHSWGLSAAQNKGSQAPSPVWCTINNAVYISARK